MLASLKLTNRSLPVLSALLLTMSGAPRLAEAAQSLAPKLAPGQVSEMIGQAATVLSTVHYQVDLAFTCGGSGCIGDFPKPGANHRLNITRISCYMRGPSGSTFEFGEAQVQDKTNQATYLREYLPADFTGADGSQLINRAVDMQIGANQHLHVIIQLANFMANYGQCTATATMETLG
jgi:hypothetical protein